MPGGVVWLARLLRYRWAMTLVSSWDRTAVARQLAARLRAAGAVCLVTAQRPCRLVEAGRAMQRLWLHASARGLAVQPHGVLPQYLTKLRPSRTGSRRATPR